LVVVRVRRTAGKDEDREHEKCVTTKQRTKEGTSEAHDETKEAMSEAHDDKQTNGSHGALSVG